MAAVESIPKGYHAVTPHLTLRDSVAALAFYAKAFGAVELMRMPSPDGKITWHAEMRVGDSIVMMADEMPGGAPAPTPEQPSNASFFIYATDCDAAWKRAVDAGARAEMPPADMFWGDRMGGVMDPFGYRWSFATHVKDVSPEEMARGAAEFAKQMAEGGGKTP